VRASHAREGSLRLKDEQTMDLRIDRFTYDDDIVRKFAVATVVWGIVGTLAGVFVALLLVVPEASLGLEWLTFGRVRPVHTNAVIFAFAGNAIFAAVYYSAQRLLKTRMFSDLLSRIHFWGWQALIVAAAVTLPLGYTQGKEYAELEWPLDIAIALLWVVFAVNFFGTLWRRREKHLYVAIWFYIASIIAVAVLHIFNNLSMPAGPLKSYSIYSGVQDAFMQWWYGHNAVAFFLTTPFLGLMYYFLPKAADRPVFSYRLSILHFWTIVFLYIWAGPHHLHYTALPEWASTLGMLFSLMLWMPSWGGMVNGLLTLRGAWNKVAEDPILKFFVAGVTFYGLATFEGPLLSIKSVNALSHYTDWTVGHVHGGALGWNGFMIAGMLYWLAPRLFQAPLWSRKLAELHFWLGIVAVLLYVIPMWAAGVTQGLMWRELTPDGRLAYPDFVETVMKLMPMYWVRFAGGTIFVTGMLLMGLNLFMTWRRRPEKYETPVVEAPALVREAPAAPPAAAPAGWWQRFLAAKWHRRWEGLPITFSVWVAVAVIAASLFEIIPTFLVKSNVPKISSVTPYTPLELAGRDIYVKEGCYNCHSQMVRPIRSETERYGEYSKAGEFVYDHPFQWGSRRIGPDLHRVGGKYPHLWHVRHMENPRSTTAESIMPAYPWMLKDVIDFGGIPARVRANHRLGVPYSKFEVNEAEAIARDQAKKIAAEIAEQGGTKGLEDKEVVALIAYLQRLGTDIKKGGPAAATGGSAAANSLRGGAATLMKAEGQ
jgi:cytochrome c oxidase cbb3-type subunit I/II